jgi:hypothetical protein
MKVEVAEEMWCRLGRDRTNNIENGSNNDSSKRISIVNSVAIMTAMIGVVIMAIVLVICNNIINNGYLNSDDYT